MMQVTWQCKAFSNLSPFELYGILQLRSSVFVVEQNCVFLDADGTKDFEALHVFAHTHTGEILACARLLPAGIAYPECSIGRVVSSQNHRGMALGRQLMERSIQEIYQHFGKQPIRIGAQYYLRKFYESYGFEVRGDTYMEDGIEHVIMLKP